MIPDFIQIDPANIPSIIDEYWPGSTIDAIEIKIDLPFDGGSWLRPDCSV